MSQTDARHPGPALIQAEPLVAAAQLGQPAAMETLLRLFQPLLHRIAGRYHHISFDDALQEARLSFLRCVRQFDSRLGVPFTAYAAIHVRGDVRTAMRRWWIYQDRQARTPAEEPQEDLTERWMAHASHRVETEDGAMAKAEWQTVFDHAGLSPRERFAMTALMEGVSMQHLAQTCGVSVETARTWRKRGLDKLRRALTDLRG
jgi:RNA polymerase sigma factor (sigma-70 family)